MELMADALPAGRQEEGAAESKYPAIIRRLKSKQFMLMISRDPHKVEIWKILLLR